MSITRKELYNTWRNEKQLTKKTDAVVKHVAAKIGIKNDETDIYCRKVRQSARMFVCILTKKWAQASRTRLTFENTNKYWLEGYFNIPPKFSSSSRDEGCLDGPSTSNYGRPSKEFLYKTERTKHRNVVPLLETWSAEELTFAAGTSLYKSVYFY